MGPKLSHSVVYGQLKLIFASIAGGWATVQDERHMFPVRNHDVCTNVIDQAVSLSYFSGRY